LNYGSRYSYPTDSICIPKYTLVYYKMENLNVTTIKLGKDTKKMLNFFKEHKSESYDEVVKKLIYIAGTAKENPQLSRKTVKEIEAARQRMKKGEFYTEKQMEELLGM
jgi:hypothetical protein